MRRHGFEVLLATDGDEGVATARKEKPDIVLMDLSLPGMDGWAATRVLKADTTTAKIPVIALTAHAMCGCREQALEAGCDDYDTKPIDLYRLLSKMSRFVADPQNADAESRASFATAATEFGREGSEVSRPRRGLRLLRSFS